MEANFLQIDCIGLYLLENPETTPEQETSFKSYEESSESIFIRIISCKFTFRFNNFHSTTHVRTHPFWSERQNLWGPSLWTSPTQKSSFRLRSTPGQFVCCPLTAYRFSSVSFAFGGSFNARSVGMVVRIVRYAKVAQKYRCKPSSFAEMKQGMDDSVLCSIPLECKLRLMRSWFNNLTWGEKWKRPVPWGKTARNNWRAPNIT